MKNILKSVILSLAFLSTSCAPAVFSTLGHNVPLFKNKNEVSVNASLVNTEDANGFGTQLAFAVDSSLAVMGSFYALSNDPEEGDDEWKGDGSYFELGAGKFGDIRRRENISYDVFLGMGFGNIHNSYQQHALDVKFIKPFIQPSIAISSKQVAEFAFTPRIALVSFTDHKIQTDDPAAQGEADKFFREKKSTVAFEPGFTLRLGYRSLKAQIQYSTTTLSDSGYQYLKVEKDYFSIGVHWLISRRFK